MDKPLSGYRFIELAGLGPAPYAGQILADMGAEVILINRHSPKGTSGTASIPMICNRGKKTIALDLAQDEGKAALLEIVKTSDGLFEGFRPGVAERLGIGPKDCHSVNPKLIYGRMTGWGQTGPWAKTAGHDINYISITGALAAMGPASSPPAPPLNLIGDFGGGTMFLVTGILAALLKAEKTGKGDVIDAAMIDGVSSMMGMFYSLSGLGQWSPERASNLLDGAMPYYRCYETKDGKYMAVGCLEPQFFAVMLERLKIDPAQFGGQNNMREHAQQRETLCAIFASQTRAHWSDVFSGSDACVTPVLDYIEAASHAQNQARGGFTQHGPFIHPRPAPVFGTVSGSTEKNSGDSLPPSIPSASGHTDEILSLIGYSAGKIAELKAKNITP